MKKKVRKSAPKKEPVKTNLRFEDLMKKALSTPLPVEEKKKRKKKDN